MPLYRSTNIPQNVWDFFDNEAGLSTTQLTEAIDIYIATATTNIKFAFLVDFVDYHARFDYLGNSDQGFNLVKYYRDQSSLSVDDLLQYFPSAIKNLVKYDQKFKLQNWLIQNNLLFPEAIIRGGHEDHIISLSKSSGIEYLNRKVLSAPQAERQVRLNEIAEMDTYKLNRDIEKTLKDSLSDVPDNQNLFSFKTVDQRFKEFKHTQNRLLAKTIDAPQVSETSVEQELDESKRSSLMQCVFGCGRRM